MTPGAGKQQPARDGHWGAAYAHRLASWLDGNLRTRSQLDIKTAALLAGAALVSAFGGLVMLWTRWSTAAEQRQSGAARESTSGAQEPLPESQPAAPTDPGTYLEAGETKGGIDDADVWMMTAVVMMPVAALVGLIVAYREVSPSHGWVYLVVGFGIPAVMFIVLFLAYLGLGFNEAQHASVDTYNDLIRRFSHIASVPPRSGSMEHSLQSAAAVAYAGVQCYGKVFTHARRKKGLHWILGKGYIDLTKTVHRAEEALIMYEPVDMVLQDGMIDQERIAGSTIPGGDALLQQVHTAMAGLSAPPYDTPTAATPWLSPGKSRILNLPGAAASHVARNNGARPQAEVPPVSHETLARVWIRDARFAVNEFRDSRKAQLIEARNELLARILLTGLATCLLLVFILIGNPPPQVLVTGAIVYAVGATVGLFAGLYADVGTEGIGEDYGNSYVRLFQAFLVSGLGAVAGVYIAVALPVAVNNPVLKPQAAAVTPTVAPGRTSTVTALATSVPSTAAAPPGSGQTQNSNGSETQMPSLSEVYNIDRYPFSILLAAIFGLAPGLVVSRLSQAAQQNVRDLRSSEQFTAPRSSKS